jgi:hypothetical protein
MPIVSSTVGSPTYTCWKRRSSAGSFSTCLRYSSSVVAPIMRSSPRASIGLIMLPASIAPSAPPAPTIVCSSSTKVTTSPAASVISLSTAFSRSSNSPRYLAPASIEAMSSEIRRLPFKPSGTSPSAMRRARPSTIAVLPTPGSPMRTGLFLVRRLSTWMTRRISSSRPMTGSILPSAAAAGEVLAVLLERGELLLGVLVGDAVAAAHVAQDAEQLLAADAEAVVHRQQQVLDRDVVVLQVLAVLLGALGDVVELARQTRFGAADRARQLVDGGLGSVADHAGGLAELRQHGHHHGPLLAGEGHQEVVGCELGIVLRLRGVDGRGERLLGLDGPLLRIERHADTLPSVHQKLTRIDSGFLSECAPARRPGHGTETSIAHADPVVGTSGPPPRPPAMSRPSERRKSVTAGSSTVSRYSR